MTVDFSNRIVAQRDFLRVVNSRAWPIEQLYALSEGAIRRWIMINRIETRSPIASLVSGATDALQFLANQSQEQITEEYRMRSQEFSTILEKAKMEMALV